jgi:hypothetical protein
MKILRNTLLVILSLILLVSPFIFVVIYAVSLPPQYSPTFYGALDEKYLRLTSTQGEKIVVVGGSSVAFGLDSKLLESYTGMPVVNFGLYADLGTKMMLDLSLAGISEGDVVILSPEIDAQTLSLFFNAEDDGKTVRAGMFGGAGVNTLQQGKFDYEGCRDDYRESVRRLMNEPVELFIGNHSWNNHTYEKWLDLVEKGENYFVSPEEWTKFLHSCEKRLDETIAKDV